MDNLKNNLKEEVETITINFKNSFNPPRFIEVGTLSNKIYLSSFLDEEMLNGLHEEKKVGILAKIHLAIACVESEEFIGSRLGLGFYEANKIRHIQVPLKSNQYSYIRKNAELLQQCVEAVSKAKEAIESGTENVLFYCGTGRRRSLTLLIATLMLLFERFNGEVAMLTENKRLRDEQTRGYKIKSEDSLEKKARKIYDYLTWAYGERDGFSSFKTLKDDVIAISEEYLRIHPNEENNSSASKNEISEEIESANKKAPPIDNIVIGFGNRQWY